MLKHNTKELKNNQDQKMRLHAGTALSGGAAALGAGSLLHNAGGLSLQASHALQAGGSKNEKMVKSLLQNVNVPVQFSPDELGSQISFDHDSLTGAVHPGQMTVPSKANPYITAHEIGHLHDKALPNKLKPVFQKKQRGLGYINTLKSEFRANKNMLRNLKQRFGTREALKGMPMVLSNMANYAGAIGPNQMIPTALGGAGAALAAKNLTGFDISKHSPDGMLSGAVPLIGGVMEAKAKGADPWATGAASLAGALAGSWGGIGAARMFRKNPIFSSGLGGLAGGYLGGRAAIRATQKTSMEKNMNDFERGFLDACGKIASDTGESVEYVSFRLKKRVMHET